MGLVLETSFVHSFRSRQMDRLQRDFHWLNKLLTLTAVARMILLLAVGDTAWDAIQNSDCVVVDGGESRPQSMAVL